MDILLILLTAVLPGVVLLFYVYRKDYMKPEPAKMLFKGVCYGFISLLLSLVVSLPLQALGVHDPYGKGFSNIIREAFFGAALPEEMAKLFMLWLLLRKNKYFDEYFDGIVYAVCVGMGFASLENLMYLFENTDNWMNVGILRAFASIPGHFAFAVFMGYYYSLAHFGKSSKTKYLILALLVPIIGHFLFDSFIFSIQECNSFVLLFLVLLVVLCVALSKLSRRKIKSLIKMDEELMSNESDDNPTINN